MTQFWSELSNFLGQFLDIIDPKHTKRGKCFFFTHPTERAARQLQPQIQIQNKKKIQAQ